MFVVFHVPYFNKTVARSGGNVMRLGRKHDAVNRNWFGCGRWSLGVEGCLEYFVIGFDCIYENDASILTAAGNDLVLKLISRCTCVVDMDAVDDSLVRVVD